MYLYLAEVKFMSFFSHLDWDNLLDTEPAFVPQPDNNMDTSYFEREYIGLFFIEEYIFQNNQLILGHIVYLLQDNIASFL